MVSTRVVVVVSNTVLRTDDTEIEISVSVVVVKLVFPGFVTMTVVGTGNTLVLVWVSVHVVVVQEVMYGHRVAVGGPQGAVTVAVEYIVS